MSNQSTTNWWTTLQFQLAKLIPTAPGNSCTAPFSATCCASPRAGGNPRTARRSEPLAHPQRRQRPIFRWCGGPAPAPLPPPRPSILGPAARRRAFPLPGRWRQNHTPVQIPGIHLPLLKKPLYPPHTHPPTPLSPAKANPVFPPNLPHLFAHFTLALV